MKGFMLAWRMAEGIEERVREVWHSVDVRVAQVIRDVQGVKRRAREVGRQVAVETAVKVEDATLGASRRLWGRVQGEQARYAAVTAIRRIYGRSHKAAQDAYKSRFGVEPGAAAKFGEEQWRSYHKRIPKTRGSRLRYILKGEFD